MLARSLLNYFYRHRHLNDNQCHPRMVRLILTVELYSWVPSHLKLSPIHDPSFHLRAKNCYFSHSITFGRMTGFSVLPSPHNCTSNGEPARFELHLEY